MPRKNTAATDYPQAVLQQIEQLAHNIAIARKRRGESQAQWARKLGISQPTMVRMERGDPSVAMASYVMCMWLINQAEGLADLVAPQYDHTALEKEVAKVRLKRKPSSRGPQPKDSADHAESAARSERSQLTPLLESQKSSARGSKPSDLTPPTAYPLGAIHQSLAHVTKLSDLIPRTTSPLGEVHKSLARATQLSDLAASRTASGIAALLANPERKKQ